MLNSAPHDQILHSIWNFRVKRSHSTNMIIKFKDGFCGNGRRQELGANQNETRTLIVKWIKMDYYTNLCHLVYFAQVALKGHRFRLSLRLS